MASFSDETLQKIRDRILVSDVAARYAKIEHRGNELWCCCPLHGEKTASMVLHDDTGFFHCFGCGAHGTAIDLVMQLFGCSAREAALKLAGDFDIPIDSSPQAKTRTKTNRLELTKDELSLLGISEGRPFEIQVNVEDNGDPVYEAFFPPTLQDAYGEDPAFITAFVIGRAKERKERCTSMMRAFRTCSEWDASMREVVRYFMIELTDIISRFGGRTQAGQA